MIDFWINFASSLTFQLFIKKTSYCSNQLFSENCITLLTLLLKFIRVQLKRLALLLYNNCLVVNFTTHSNYCSNVILNIVIIVVGKNRFVIADH